MLTRGLFAVANFLVYSSPARCCEWRCINNSPTPWKQHWRSLKVIDSQWLVSTELYLWFPANDAQNPISYHFRDMSTYWSTIAIAWRSIHLNSISHPVGGAWQEERSSNELIHTLKLLISSYVFLKCLYLLLQWSKLAGILFHISITLLEENIFPNIQIDLWLT